VIAAVGGSQGSKFINDNFLKLVDDLRGDYDFIHLTGPKDYEEISRFYSKIGIKAFVKDFWDRMDIIYCAADILLCRAGALTVAEVSYFNIPAVFIPHPQAGSHQYCNAEYLQKAAAAILFEQNGFSFDDFKNTVKSLVADEDMRQKMADRLKNIDIVVSSHEFYKNILS
jgi:UDP-N-acetylglucosamine--N-acetylmuramyl-(pentapeptide) pyrophosphoryl-undecaprenol N-acetylglucosamine transferase